MCVGVLIWGERCPQLPSPPIPSSRVFNTLPGSDRLEATRFLHWSCLHGRLTRPARPLYAQLIVHESLVHMSSRVRRFTSTHICICEIVKFLGKGLSELRLNM